MTISRRQQPRARSRSSGRQVSSSSSLRRWRSSCRREPPECEQYTDDHDADHGGPGWHDDDHNGGGAVRAVTSTTAAHTTTTKAEHKGKTTTTTTAPPSATTVVVANGTSVNGLAAHYSTVIGAGGWTMKTPIDAATSVPTSAVYYAAGQQQQAGAIATSIGIKPAQVLPITTATPVTGATGIDVVVVIGVDLATTTTTTT